MIFFFGFYCITEEVSIKRLLVPDENVKTLWFSFHINAMSDSDEYID